MIHRSVQADAQKGQARSEEAARAQLGDFFGVAGCFHPLCSGMRQRKAWGFWAPENAGVPLMIKKGTAFKPERRAAASSSATS